MATKKFGKAIDLSRLLDNRRLIKPRITSVGIELEGGWKTNPSPYRIIRDGSVHGLNGYQPIDGGMSSPRDGYGLAGELPSPVLKLDSWEEWVMKYYPEAINHTCGMHVHMGFGTAMHYMKCMDPQLPATVVEYFKRWAGDNKLDDRHPIWPRLRGESQYCQHVYAGEDQIMNNSKDHSQTRQGHRYTVMNYAYGRTGTVECRLLPMMDTPKMAVSAIKELIDITNAFLIATAAKEKKVTATLAADPEGSPRVRQLFI